MELGLELIALLMAVAFVAGMIDAVAGGGGLITIPQSCWSTQPTP